MRLLSQEPIVVPPETESRVTDPPEPAVAEVSSEDEVQLEESLPAMLMVEPDMVMLPDPLPLAVVATPVMLKAPPDTRVMGAERPLKLELVTLPDILSEPDVNKERDETGWAAETN